MGAACCVTAKDRTITSSSPVEPLQRHIRYSPTWSFRWDNRVRVAEEETTAYWLRSRGCGNETMESKPGDTTTETAIVSERDGPLGSSQSRVWRKAPVSEVTTGSMMISSRDESSPQTIITEVKESTGSPSVSYPSPIKSPTVPSVSSMSASPLSSQSPSLPPNSAPSGLHDGSPAYKLLRQASDTRFQGYKLPTLSISEEPSWANESTRGVTADSYSDTWSNPGFSELMNTRKDSWSLDSEASGVSRDQLTRSSGRNSRSLSFDLPSCGICTKVLAETNVVSVLTCGHVYHCECLEHVTPEINKYDPPCPVCTFGEKKIAKMSERALKSEMNSKARKTYKKCISSSDVSSHYYRRGGIDGKGPQLSSSLSTKSSLGKKPFLIRHFSFGSKFSKTSLENQSSSANGLLHCYKSQ